MGTSKILIDGVGIDLTQDTVAANKMLSGIKAHDSNGDSVTGNIQTWAGTQASGVKQITENGTYDVSQYSSAQVNVPPERGRIYIVTLSSKATNGQIIATDSAIAEHYNDDSLVTSCYRVSGATNIATQLYSVVSNHNNKGDLSSHDYFGVSSYILTNGNVGTDSVKTPANTVGEQSLIYVDSDGNVRFHSNNPYDRPYAVGTYLITVSW